MIFNKDTFHKEDDDEPFANRECYVFNQRLDVSDNDAYCIHCAKFMTLQCDHIGEFIDEE